MIAGTKKGIFEDTKTLYQKQGNEDDKQFQKDVEKVYKFVGINSTSEQPAQLTSPDRGVEMYLN